MSCLAMTEDMLVFTVLGVSLLVTFVGCADYTGTEFAVMFAEKDESHDISISEILLTVSGPTSTFVTISVPGHNYLSSHTIGHTKQLNVTLPAHIKHWNSLIIEPNGISISANDAVAVRCINKYTAVSQGYLAIPKHAASTNYLAVSYDPAGRNASYILITAYNNATTVNVIFKFPSPGKCVNMDAEVSTGYSLTFTLNSLDVWGVRCDQDLTGTSITSSAPVAVVSGLASLFSVLPFLETMLLPVDLYGSNYVLTTHTAGAMYRVVAASSDTLVSLASNMKMLLGAGDFVDIPKSNALSCMTTNKPVQVVMLGVASLFGSHTLISSLAVPMMMPIPQVDRFLTSYQLHVESSSNMTTEHYITMVAPSDHIDVLAASIQYLMIMVNETSQCCNMSQVIGTVVDGTTVNVSSSVPFIIIYNGLELQSGALHGYIGGASLDPVTCPVGEGYQYLTNPKLCVKVNTPALNWSEARVACLASGDRLVKLNTQLKNIAVINMVSNHAIASTDQYIWIGLRQYNNSSSGVLVWRWTDGESIHYEGWGEGQPDNSGPCGQLLYTLGYKWDDYMCASRNPHVCEKVLHNPQPTSVNNTCIHDIVSCSATSGYTYVMYSNTSMCLRLSDTRKTWTQGLSECQNSGGHLVKVDTQEKNTLLYTYLKLETTVSHWYIGLWDTDNIVAVWTDCTSVNFTNWYGVEPNKETEECIQMNLIRNGQWLDRYCDTDSRFVCEADTDNNHVAGYLDENDKFQCNASVLMTSYSSDVAATVVTDINSDIVESTSVKAASSPATTLPEPSTSFPIEPTPSSTVTSVPFHTDPTPFNTETAALETMAIFSTLETSEIQLFGVTDTIDIQPTVSEDMETKLTSDPNPARVTKEVCRCACIPTGRLSDLSPLVLKKKEDEIRRDLILNTKTLTMTIAKVKSAEDERKSAVGIGLLGVFLISCPLILIILSDLCTVKFRR